MEDDVNLKLLSVILMTSICIVLYRLRDKPKNSKLLFDITEDIERRKLEQLKYQSENKETKETPNESNLPSKI